MKVWTVMRRKEREKGVACYKLFMRSRVAKHKVKYGPALLMGKRG